MPRASSHRTRLLPLTAVSIHMAIAARASNLSRDDLQVKKGDKRQHQLHRRRGGRDPPARLRPHRARITRQPGALNFVADTAGAFGINFHVFASDSMKSDAAGSDSHHAADAPAQVISDRAGERGDSAQPDAEGGVDVQITTEGFRFAPDLVDQAHTPGAGHAHIYLDGEKLGRVFESEYRIADAPPGEHEVRVSLNTNDHSELVFDGRKVEATVTVNVPDVGQGHGDGDRDTDHEGDGHDHDGHDHGEHEVIAEVHLGNLEVYP